MFIIMVQIPPSELVHFSAKDHGDNEAQCHPSTDSSELLHVVLSS